MVNTVEEALEAAIHDLEIAYAAPLAILTNGNLVYDYKAIRQEYSRRFDHEDGRPQWMIAPQNGVQSRRMPH